MAARIKDEISRLPGVYFLKNGFVVGLNREQNRKEGDGGAARLYALSRKSYKQITRLMRVVCEVASGSTLAFNYSNI